MVTYYFYIDTDNVQRGPLTLQQLSEQQIISSTLIWYEGLDHWTPAASVESLKQILCDITPPTPPPFDQNEESEKQNKESEEKINNTPIPSKPRGMVLASVLATILCCLPTGIIALIYALRIDDLWNEGRYLESQKAAKKAKRWVLISLFCIPLIAIILITLPLMVGIFSSIAFLLFS